MIRPKRPHSGARIALAHDWIVGGRGGEWVLDRLARLFGPTRIYTLVYDGRPPTEAIAACEIVTSPLQRVPGARGRLRRVALPLLPWAVGRLEVEPCDLLISSSSAVMKSIRPPLGTPHLCYCHTPPRYIWDQAGDYAYGAGGAGRRLGLALIRHPFQRWDRSTAAGVTRFLANSHHTAGRIARWYGREAAVVPPPVRTDFYCPDPRVARESWLLVVSALEPYKRVDLAIAAANLAGWALKVVGDGTQRRALSRQAGPSVELLGRVPDEELRNLYRRAAALLFPQREDFGIVAVEAQATGCPVAAFAAGGGLETVSEECGAFFREQTPEAIIHTVDRLRQRSIDQDRCRANALRFAPEHFDQSILRHVSQLLNGIDWGTE